MEFGEKVKTARKLLKLSQIELSEMTGISTRSIYAYEQENIKPKRSKYITALAKALNVSTEYLMNDEETDPLKNLESDYFLNKVNNEYGIKAKKEAKELLERTGALFAGGELDEEDRDVFMRSIMQVYLDTKNITTEKYGKKTNHPKSPDNTTIILNED